MRDGDPVRKSLIDPAIARDPVTAGIIAPFRHWRFALLNLIGLTAVFHLAIFLWTTFLAPPIWSNPTEFLLELGTSGLICLLVAFVLVVPFLTAWHRAVLFDGLGGPRQSCFPRISGNELRYALYLAPLIFVWIVDTMATVLAESQFVQVREIPILGTYTLLQDNLRDLFGNTAIFLIHFLVVVAMKFISLVFPASSSGHWINYVQSVQICSKYCISVALASCLMFLLIFCVIWISLLIYGHTLEFLMSSKMAMDWIAQATPEDLQIYLPILFSTVLALPLLTGCLVFLVEAAFMSVLYRTLMEKRGEWPKFGMDQRPIAAFD